MASISRVIYVGVTNDLMRRVHEHRIGTGSEFTSKYRISKLVYFERHNSILEAIAREKVIKGWKRIKKISLIESNNKNWTDLARS